MSCGCSNGNNLVGATGVSGAPGLGSNGRAGTALHSILSRAGINVNCGGYGICLKCMFFWIAVAAMLLVVISRRNKR